MKELAIWVWIILIAFFFGAGIWQLGIYFLFVVLAVSLESRRKF